MGGVLASIARWLLDRLFGRSGAAEIAAARATAEARLAQETASHDIVRQASAARAAADARRLHGDAGADAVDASPDSALNRDPDGHWRD